MNIQFKYDDVKKKIIVSNENGILTEMDFQNNIGELFILKDILEELEKIQTDLNSEYEEISNDLLKKSKEVKERETSKKTQIIRDLVFFPGGTIACDFILSKLINDIHTLTPTRFGKIEIRYFVGILSSVLFLIGVICRRLSIKKIWRIEPSEEYEELTRKKRGLECEIQSLEKILERYKKHCNVLKANKEQTASSTMTTKIQTVHYREQLEKEKAYLKLMYNCAYNEKEYADFYQNGCLLEELHKEHSVKDSSIIYSYIEEKFGPTRELNLKNKEFAK